MSRHNLLIILIRSASKRGQEQQASQQLGNYGTTFFSASRQSYWNMSRGATSKY